MPHLLGGGLTTLRIPSDPPPSVQLYWTSAYNLAKMGGKWPGYGLNAGARTDKFTQTQAFNDCDPLPRVHNVVARTCPAAHMKRLNQLEGTLLSSRFWISLQERLETLTVPIKNIVCMALGSLDEPIHDFDRRGSQHAFACAVSKSLTRQQTSSSSSTPVAIPICAHDPIYTAQDVDTLSSLTPPITVVSDPEHYLQITPNTLIIAICIPAFISFLDIAADVCFPSGPAAILSYETWEHPWHKDGLVTSLDQRSPRVNRMLRGFEAEWLGREIEGDKEGAAGVINCWADNMFLYTRKE